MGRGRSGETGGGSWKAEKSVRGSDGNPIDLNDSPLRYSSDDSSVAGNVRTVIDAFEKARVKNKIEFARIVDANGNIIEERRGGSGSVRSSVRALNNGDTFSHNHPREGGMLGGTFSTADLNNFANYGVRVYRAAAPEGTYSISKGRNFDSAGLKRYYAAEHAAAQRQYRSDVRALGNKYSEVTKAYRAGTATRAEADRAYKDYQAGAAKAFNKWLVSNHNALIAGQRQYGYTYSLERRKQHGKDSE